MKHIVSFICILILLLSFILSAFSYDIDGIDNGYEWDGATVCKILDGESNCGVNFGVIKYKFDYETSAVVFCFMFSDPDFTPENDNAGILLSVEDSSFEFNASDGTKSDNIDPYSFDGAIYLDENNGATAEIIVGIKAGLPKSLDCCVRFIDSQGYYSNYYHFIVINDEYEEPDTLVIYPTTESYIKPETTRKTTTKKTTQKRTTTIKTTAEPTTKKIKTTKADVTATKLTTTTTTKPTTKVQNNVTIIYHEKEVYISHVYIKPTTEETTTLPLTSEISVSETSEKIPDETVVTLSQGTKYKKILSAVGLTAFVAIACFGIYSAKKTSDNKEK